MIKKIVVFLAFFGSIFAFTQEEIKNSYLKSYDYEKMGKYSEALKVLAPIYEAYPKGYTLNLRFGWLYFLDKKYTNAIEYYKRASLANIYAVDPKLGIIRVYLATASYQKAEQSAYEILKTDFYNYYANLYAVTALIYQQKYDIATEIVNKMLYLYPTDILFLEQLSVVYKETNNKYLQELYQDILILDPNNIHVNIMLSKQKK
ncbi:MAG: hypothetical protein QG567_927 [Campylobacterota bacterium]|nr:hypothetical protein [Campylobacterota bacterium]